MRAISCCDNPVSKPVRVLKACGEKVGRRLEDALGRSRKVVAYCIAGV